MDVLEGVLRMMLPLLCVCLAAEWYYRAGVINIAIDGQILIAAVVYAGSSHLFPSWVSMIFATVSAAVIGGALVELRQKYRLDDLLTGLGLLYIAYGASQLLSDIFSGNPGYTKAGPFVVGEWNVLIAGVSICALTLIIFPFLRPLRLSKLMAQSQRLAAIHGINLLRRAHIHSLVAAMFIGLAAIYLVENGGSYASQVSGQRGFLALAIISVARHNLWSIAGASIIFAIGQKYVYEVQLPNELVEAAPYLLGIVLLGIFHNRNNSSLR